MQAKYIQYEELKNLIDNLVGAGEGNKPFEPDCPFITTLSDMVKKVRFCIAVVLTRIHE